MTAPTLFDALQEHPEPFRPRPAQWCAEYEQMLDVWRIHGVPADLSTVQTAITILFALHAEHRALFDALFGEHTPEPRPSAEGDTQRDRS